MVSLAVDETNLSEGLRAASAASAMLVLGLLFDHPDFSWAAIGAFWTCLADAAGTRRMRFVSMAGFGLLSTLAGGVAALAAGHGVAAAALAVLLFSWAGALARIWGAAAAQVAILAATACVVMVTHPLYSLAQALPFLAIYLSGCLFATVLSFTVWRIHPYGPSRQAIRTAYLRLAGIARDNARYLAKAGDQAGGGAHGASYRSQARAALEAARVALAAVPPSRAGHSAPYDKLLLALSDAERIFAYLIAVTHSCERERQRLRHDPRARRSLAAMALLLRRLGLALRRHPETPLLPLQRRLAACGRRLEAALGALLPLRLNVAFMELDLPRTERLPWRLAAAQALAQGWQTLGVNASLQSLGWRHAARVALTTTSAFLLVELLRIPFGYWATMATLLILQPSVSTTWPRGIERVAGSIAGALLAVLIGLVIHTPLAISLVVFPMIVATMALRRVSYSLHVMFMTPAFVLVADYAMPASEMAYAFSRLGNNVLGCVLALLATFFLWPDREADDLEPRLAGAVSANLKYLLAVLAVGGKWDASIARQRREAGLASNNAEQVLQRLRIERRLDRSAGVGLAALRTLPLLRRVAGSTARISLSPDALPATPVLQQWIAAVGSEIDALLRGDPQVPSPGDCLATDLSPLQADAVAQVLMLRILLRQQLGVRGVLA
ncbi:putative membrane protein YccC [Janthinobacterium psychrotolerans]|uniref:Putative membrane protein YccC n=2 Tax=Janthinobacterium psychrotolerans TaxID=1747903 RepID=A0A1A7C233_9BURK|nr:putative membrane protein YccC [Janthinobacterium psychrotolerans]